MSVFLAVKESKIVVGVTVKAWTIKPNMVLLGDDLFKGKQVSIVDGRKIGDFIPNGESDWKVLELITSLGEGDSLKLIARDVGDELYALCAERMPGYSTMLLPGDGSLIDALKGLNPPTPREDRDYFKQQATSKLSESLCVMLVAILSDSNFTNTFVHINRHSDEYFHSCDITLQLGDRVEKYETA